MKSKSIAISDEAYWKLKELAAKKRMRIKDLADRILTEGVEKEFCEAKGET